MSEITSRDDKCPDGGTCHHGCAEENCFRVGSCGPLSGVYRGDVWPKELTFNEKLHQSHLGACEDGPENTDKSAYDARHYATLLLMAAIVACFAFPEITAHQAKAKIAYLKPAPLTSLDAPGNGVDALLVASREADQSTIGCVHISDSVGSGWQPVEMRVDARGKVSVSGYISESVTRAWSNLAQPLRDACEKTTPIDRD